MSDDVDIALIKNDIIAWRLDLYSTETTSHFSMSLNKTIKIFYADVKSNVLEHYRMHDENGIPYERYVQKTLGGKGGHDFVILCSSQL